MARQAARAAGRLGCARWGSFWGSLWQAERFILSAMTTTIRPGTTPYTLINVFVVEPPRQRELVELLCRATREVICRLPGFISANIHESHDGTQVVNYAQWRSREDFEAMLRDPAAQPHLREAAMLASSFAPNFYKVVEVFPHGTAHA